MYTWEGMRKMNIKEVLKKYSDNTLVGCFYLYRDGSEGMIEKGVTIEDIIRKYFSGVEFGEEKIEK